MEIKVVAASVVTLVVSVLIAILNAVAADSSMLGGLPAPLQVIVLVVIPPVLTWLGGYAKSSSTSSVSEGYVRDAA